MHTIIYKFEVKPNQENIFIASWEKLTSIVYKCCGSLGSRLHKQSENNYIAYAQWPDEKTFKTADWPEEANKQRYIMRSACTKVEILHKLEVISDLLKEK